MLTRFLISGGGAVSRLEMILADVAPSNANASCCSVDEQDEHADDSLWSRLRRGGGGEGGAKPRGGGGGAGGDFLAVGEDVGCHN